MSPHQIYNHTLHPPVEDQFLHRRSASLVSHLLRSLMLSVILSLACVLHIFSDLDPFRQYLNALESALF